VIDIYELNSYYFDGIIVFREWEVKLFEILNEDNFDEIIEVLKEKELLDRVLKSIENYPRDDEGWKNYIIVRSYCGTETPEQIREREKRELAHFKEMVGLFRKKLRL